MATGRSLEGILKFLDREEWRFLLDEMLDRHLSSACAKAGVTFQELYGVIGDHHASVLWGCVFEDLMTQRLDDGGNIVDDYLKRRGWKESASNKAYMTALRSSVMSLYEISGIVFDESFLARDLIRGGEPVRVAERSGTRYLKPWDRMAARLVQVGSRIEMAGGALPLDFDTSETVLKELRLAMKKAWMAADRSGRRRLPATANAPIVEEAFDTEVLRASAFLFTTIWLDRLLQRTLNPHPPQIRNTDGDEIAFTTVSYPLVPGTGAEIVRIALEAVPALRPESETFWNWIGFQQPVRKKRSDGQTFVTTLDDGSLVLGTIELKDKKLVLEVNSPQRAERGRELIGPVVKELVGEPTVESRSVAQLIESRLIGKPEKQSSGLPSGEEQAMVQASMDQYYANLLDERVPMLGNMTPRRAAKSVKGREKLVAWLKLLENSTARQESGSAMAGYDVTWLWKELGVLELRR